MTGKNVSHANNRTNRRFDLNLQRKRFWLDDEQRWVTLTLSAKGQRIIDKQGIETVVRDLRARGEQI